MFLVFQLKIVSLRYLIKLLVQNFFDGLLFFTQDGSVAIIPCKKESQYYLVDLHVRDTEGKPDANGSKIIIKFEDIPELISYVTDIYENTLSMKQ